LNSESALSNATIIFNPLAGRGKTPSIANKAKSFLTQQGWATVNVIQSEYAGHIENVLADEWGKQSQLIVLIGGDGTLRELVSGLRTANLHTEIAFIPTGNANVVARELGIPLKPQHAIELLGTRDTKEVDLCVLKQDQQPDQIFLAMLEVGFGAKTVSICTRLRNGPLKTAYKLWGDFVYGIAAVMALKGLSEKTFNITLDNNAQSSISTHCVVANMRNYAKGWSLTPDAVCDDGRIATAISKQTGTVAIFRTFFAASLTKKLDPTYMDYKKANHVEISNADGLFVQIDGDPITLSGKAQITVEKGAFAIRVKATT